MSDNANKGGRKRIPIDQKVFENLCSIQCTLAEIAAVIGCSEESQKGKASLRRLQFKHAETNPTMAIWLGKQWLGQRDQMEVEASGKVTIIDDIPDTETEKQED